MKKKLGYVGILSRPQIVDACKLAENGTLVPVIASLYALTINQCVYMLHKELHGQFIKFKKYGNKRYKWKDPKVKADLSALIEQGFNDDEIAELWETSWVAVIRGRSYAGLVAYNRITAKGHQSKHEFSHLINNKEMTQSELQFTTVKESNGVEQRVAQTVKDEVILPPIKKEPRNNELTVCFSASDDIPRGVKDEIVARIDWRSIAMRLKDSDHLYVLTDKNVTYYYRQTNADPYSGLVTLSLVRKVTAK